MTKNPKEIMSPIFEVKLIDGNIYHTRSIKFEGNWIIFLEPHILNLKVFKDNKGDAILIPNSQVYSIYKAMNGLVYEEFEKINMVFNYGSQEGLKKLFGKVKETSGNING